jgi:exopolyphosphatase / guanosine-5'-triphosphate,3'-diphosphate pyrophosphatase
MVDSLYQIKPNLGNFAKYTSEKDCVLAAIDIGTNSIHMVVVKINAQLKTFSIITTQKDTVRLGDRNPKTKELTPEAISRSISSLKRCKDLMNSLNVDHIVAVATSATRESPNGLEFLEQVERETGIKVDLISGQEEARRIYLGVVSGMDFNHDPQVLIDIGGGSTELILADRYEPRFLSSTKVGAVRLTQEFITTDPISPEEYTYLQAYIKGMLERTVDELNSCLKPNEQPRLIATSGTAETLATIIALEQTESNLIPLNGYIISNKDLKIWVKRLASMSYEERLAVSGMNDRRGEIIIAGSLILSEAMSLLNIDYLTISERALREGVIIDWMLTHGYIDSHFRYQSEIRPRSVLKIAHKYQVNLESNRRIAEFALKIFDDLQGYLHNFEGLEREWLWGSAILYNCGLYVSHSAYHKHSYYLIRNAEFLGFTEIEIEIMANIARYHRKSKPKRKHDPYKNLSSFHQKLIKQLGAILRLAVALDRRQIGAIASLDCVYNSSTHQVDFILKPSNNNDDCALELWNFDFEKPIFEEEYQVSISVTK